MKTQSPVTNRLEILKQLGFPDQPEDLDFDDTTHLAQKLLNADIATVSLVGEDQQWFRSAQGTQVGVMPINQSTCQYAIQQKDLFEIEDLRDDPRIPNPIEADGRELRHYAGMPLFVEGVGIGTLCVLNEQPGSITASNANTLTSLAGQVERQIEHLISKLQHQETLEQLETILAEIGEGIVVIDDDGRPILFNDTLTSMCNLSPEDLDETYEDAIEEMLSQVQNPQVIRNQVNHLIHQEPDARDVDLVHRTDGRVYERYTVPRNRDGETQGRVWRFRDVTEEQEARQRAEFLASHDPVTELPNRREFLSTLENALSCEPDRLAVAVSRIHPFSRIEQVLGFEVGNWVLETTTEYVQSELPDDLYLASLARGTFAAFLADPEADKILLNHISDWSDMMEKLTDEEGIDFDLRANVGIAVYPEHAETAEDLIRLAQRAQGKAEASTAQDVELFLPDLMGDEQHALKLEQNFRRGLNNKDLTLHYQPRIDLSNDRVVGAEALIRWNHPEEGWIAPNRILDFAEMTQRQFKLDQFVIETALRQLENWNQQANWSEFSISINLTHATFLQYNDVLNTIQSALDHYEVDPHQVEFEITEQNAMEDVDYTVSTLQNARELGLTTALDDFGTGYSSLEYLNQFPLDVLKIDRTFVSHVDQNPSSQSLLQAILDLSEEMDLATVAEGPERQEEVEFLKKRNCDYAQGYYYSKPLPADELEDFMESDSVSQVQ